MQRRTFLGTVATSAVAGSAVASGETPVRASRQRRGTRPRADPIPELLFDSTCSLLNADGEPLTDDSVVAVWAEDAARITDADDGGGAVTYGDAAIPLVAVDGNVAGFGAPVAKDELDFAYGNDEFYLNLWDELVGGGTVLWEEGHDQYYHLGRHEKFEAYAEKHGYTVEATTSLAEDLSGADGVVVTTPSVALSEAERSALADFAAAGGAVFLHSQSDYRNFDATANLNDVASALGAGFRFNDAQVVDDENNTGPNFTIVTDRFNTDQFGGLFQNRRGIGAGPKFASDEGYTATVREVYDGDTFVVEFPDGGTDEVRVLGVDTPETPGSGQYELPHEWEGLGGVAVDDDYPYLSSWGAKAKTYAKERLQGSTVTLTFDRQEGIKDPFGRVLAYVHRDGRLYSKDLIRKGYARVFDSGLSRHDELLRAELNARREGRGLWAESNPNGSKPYRTGSVEELFFPNPAPVTVTEGSPDDSQVPVFAESSASTAEAPLVGVDAGARVAVVSAPFVAEAFEKPMGFPVSTASFGNFALLTNLADALAGRTGDVLFDGGHGQFGASAGLSAEDVSFYQRYLESHDVGLEGVNTLSGGLLDRGRALVVSTPTVAIDGKTVDAIRSFRDAGGAVILMGSAGASTGSRVELNSVASALDTDLRLSLSGLTDEQANLAGKPSVVTTTNFNDSFGLFGAYERGTATLPTTPGSTATATGTSTSSVPGMGVVSAAAGTVGGALALSRLRGDD